MSIWFHWINHRAKNNLQEVLETDGETSQIESSYTEKTDTTTLNNPLIKPITGQPINPTTTYSPPSNELTEKEKKANKKANKKEKEKEESPFSPFFKLWGH